MRMESQTGATRTYMGGQFSHRPLGTNVGYLDGHVEFLRYTLPLDPKNFPMSPFMVVMAQGFGPTDLSEMGCK